MRKSGAAIIALVFIMVSCGSPSGGAGSRVITVSIPPFAWFVKGIGGDDFTVNTMLPPGADHHIWEPLPSQITSLAASEGFVLNGWLDFEQAWIGRFLEINPDMKVLNLSSHIELAGGETGAHGYEIQNNAGHLHEGVDPHYWMSPLSAYVMAEDVKNFLTELNPGSAGKYAANHAAMVSIISSVDSVLRAAILRVKAKGFMIYHPALTYLAHDYGLEQIPFEDEGKSPSPARMKELIDTAREKQIGIIFIQAEYDIRSAKSLADETGAELVVIDPMNIDWEEAVLKVADAIVRYGKNGTLSRDHGAKD
jgi:zinc transport system substrate-binding protein